MAEMKNEQLKYLLQVKNSILHLTDDYIKQLDKLSEEVLKDLPQRDLYSDKFEVERIKLAHFVDIIKQYSNKAISEGMINIEMRNKIKNLLTTNLKGKQKKIIELISKGYTKQKIASEMNLKPTALRKQFERLGATLLNNKLVIAYLNEDQTNIPNIINDNSGFYDIFDFIQSFFEGLN